MYEFTLFVKSKVFSCDFLYYWDCFYNYKSYPASTKEICSHSKIWLPIYNHRQVHYEKWWDLKNSLSLHYGIWQEDTKNFKQSLENTNRILMEMSNIADGDRVLDAGCGVGGEAFYISENKKVEVVGITLGVRQLEFAKAQIDKKQLNGKVEFHLMDYSKTSFENASLDVVWACESITSAIERQLFLIEMFRVLKPGGRLILSDFFLTKNDQLDPNEWIRKWVHSWWVKEFVSCEQFVDELKQQNFIIDAQADYTSDIFRSARKMYVSGILAAIPSELYNLFHPKVSGYAKHHYKSGYYQYKGLRKGLWKYNVVLASKPK